MKKLNKGISTPVGILIILIFALLVGGILVWQFFVMERGEVKPPGEEIILTEEETADWRTYRTYRNEEYGFEVKYAKDWSIEGNQDSIYFKRTAISQEEIEEKQVGYPLSILIENTSGESILNWFENEFSDRAQNLSPEKQLMTIGGLNGIRYSDPISMGGCGEIFAMIKNGKLFRFLRHGSTCDYSDKLFTNIISTFRFLE